MRIEGGLRRIVISLSLVVVLAGCVSDTWIYTCKRGPEHPRWAGPVEDERGDSDAAVLFDQSGRHAVLKEGRPEVTSTSTKTVAASTPLSVAERTRASTGPV
jgi:hypothetical protein